MVSLNRLDFIAKGIYKCDYLAMQIVFASNDQQQISMQGPATIIKFWSMLCIAALLI